MNTHSDVSDRPPDSPNNSSESQPKAFVREEFIACRAVGIALALAVTILSAVADCFGICGPPGSANVSWGDWPHFGGCSRPKTLAPPARLNSASKRKDSAPSSSSGKARNHASQERIMK